MSHDLFSLPVFDDPHLKAGSGNDSTKTALLTFFVHLLLSVLLGWGITHLVSSILHLSVSEAEFLPALILFAALLYLMLRTSWGFIPIIIFAGLHILLLIIFRQAFFEEIRTLYYACMDPSAADYQDITHVLILYGYLNIFFGMSVPVLKMKPLFLAFVPVLPVVIFLTVKQSPSVLSVIITAFSLMAIFLSGRSLRTMEAMDENIPYQAKVILPLTLTALILIGGLSVFFKTAVYDPMENRFTEVSEKVTEDFFNNLLDKITSSFINPDQDKQKEKSEQTKPTEVQPEKKPGEDEDKPEPPDINPDEEGPGTKHTLSFRAILMIFLPLILISLLIIRFIRHHTALLSKKHFEKASERETFSAVYGAIKKQAAIRKTPFTEDSSYSEIEEMYPGLDPETITNLQKKAKEAAYSDHIFTEDQTDEIFRLYKSRKFLKKKQHS